MMKTVIAHSRHTSRASGFTLIELMITVMIIGVLAAIAIPQYQQFVTKTRRAEAKSGLARVQGALERYFTINNGYTTNPRQLKLTPCSDTTTPSGDTCESSNYIITIAAPAGGSIKTGFVLTATPAGDRSDPTCGVLSVDNLNEKKASGTDSNTPGTCW